jgi:uncharacterized protein (UPF0218 family)
MPVHPLPNDLRLRLKRPLGSLLNNSNISRDRLLLELEGADLTVSVGDATTELLLSLGFFPDVEIVDGREMRRDRDPPPSAYRILIPVSNPAGCLTDEAIDAVSEALRSEKPARILVEGEEDLLTLPVLACYPIGTVLCYGQPNSGLVVLHIDEKLRKLAVSFLRQMGVLWDR